MGLDYTYILVIKKSKREKLINFIKASEEVCESESICINFEVDSFILKYLEGGYDWKPHYDKKEMNQYLTLDNKARIGGIDYLEREVNIHGEELVVSFTAVTSDMSHLFQESISIRNWFIMLSKKVDAIITYLDMEGEGHRIIYFNGRETALEFVGEGLYALKRKPFLCMMDEFLKHFRPILTSYHENRYKFEKKVSLVIRKENITKLHSFIEKNGRFNEDKLDLYFFVDSTLLKYFEDGHGEKEYGISQGAIPHFNKDLVFKNLNIDYLVKLDNIIYVEEEIEGEEENLLVSFIPQKFKVDALFSKSLSIRSWIIELSKEVSAKIAFQGIWNNGYGHRIIYYQGEETNVEFTGHFDLDINTFSDIYRVFETYVHHFE